MTNFTPPAAMKRATEYKHKAKVLRQIQSAKLGRTRLLGNFLDYATILFTLIVTFLTFFGTDHLHKLFFSSLIEKEKLDFLFDCSILVLLFASFMQVTLKLGEKQALHLGNMKRITAFITFVDDVLKMDQLTSESAEQIVEKLNADYDSITEGLPENSDREWRSAKKVLGDKALK